MLLFKSAVFLVKMNGVTPSMRIRILLRPRGEVKGILITGGKPRAAPTSQDAASSMTNAPLRGGVFYHRAVPALPLENQQLLEPLALAVVGEVVVDGGYGAEFAGRAPAPGLGVGGREIKDNIFAPLPINWYNIPDRKLARWGVDKR
jgi:hypothetical protein